MRLGYGKMMNVIVHYIEATTTTEASSLLSLERQQHTQRRVIETSPTLGVVHHTRAG